MYSYWMILRKIFEGGRRWLMGRFDIDTDAEAACDIVRRTLTCGVGGDPAEVIEAEFGYDDGIWRDYTDVVHD